MTESTDVVRLRTAKMTQYRAAKRHLAAAEKLVASVGSGHPKLTPTEREAYNDHMALYAAHTKLCETLAETIADTINRRAVTKR